MEENEVSSIFLHDSETTCNICYAEFLEYEDLSIHIEQMHRSTRSCQFCPTSYTDLCDYAIHIRDVHLCYLNYCVLCSKVFLKNSDLSRHVVKHTSPHNVLNCSECSETFTNTTDLEQHEFSYHSANSDGVMLQECSRELSSYINMKVNVFLQSVSTNTSLTCLKCRYTTTTPIPFIKHLQKKKCRSNVCDVCMAVFKNKKCLRQHMFRHNQFDFTKNYSGTKLCTRCNQYVLKSIFNKHILLCKPIECQTCCKVFETLQELSEHQLVAHPAALELKTCRFCQRECVGDDILQKHIERIHRNKFHLYKYLCVYCDTPFKHPKKLFGHYFTKHKDINPYTCEICDKPFRLRKRFTLHIKLEHLSKGFVEFDEKYHVHFREKRSEKPFKPRCVLSDEIQIVQIDDSDATDIERPSKTEQRENDNLINLNSDFMDPTETEGNFTEKEEFKPNRVPRKRKLKRVAKNPKIRDIEEVSSSDDDEPLVKVRERGTKGVKTGVSRQRMEKSRQKFTCKQCNKYCYTYLNYHQHLSLHSKHEAKKCVKCLKNFKNKADLHDHMAREHSTSKLTETLRSILAKRKCAIANVTELSPSQKFQRTIRKVNCSSDAPPVKVTIAAKDGLSVQKFIESFTPEFENIKKDIKINNSVTLKAVSGDYHREPVIRMVKFQPRDPPELVKLAMPVPFKAAQEHAKATIKVVNQPMREPFIRPEPTVEYSDLPDNADFISEVAEEVMLSTEKPQTAHDTPKIVIPKLPAGYKDIHIAHLLPEAPFFKIVKVKEVLKVAELPEEPVNETVKLPDGTKLVTVNPLEHLLKGKQVSEVLNVTKNKYYQPKQTNFETAVAKAMQKLDMQPSKKNVRQNRSMPVLPVEQ